MYPLLAGPRARRIFTLALPIIGGMISQNILNLVDTAMVGTLGDPALAAVGLGGFANFMCMALILGISTGVQATAARRKGEGRDSETAVPLNGGLLLVAVSAIPLSILLYFLAPYFYPLLNSDEQVIALGVPYLQLRLVAMVAVGANFAFRGYWNAVDLSKVYMRTLIIMHTANVFISYGLIFGEFGLPEMGVAGAALGTTISVFLGTAIYFFLAFKMVRAQGFLRGLPSRDEIRGLVKLSVPNSIQQLFFAAGWTTLYWIIGKVGTPELAAANVLINVTLVAILPAMGFGIAAASLVGQALGAGNVADAKAWGYDVVKVACVLLTFISIPMWLIPDVISSVFLHDPNTIELARAPMRLVGLTIFMEAFGMVLMNALLGAGDTRRVMMVSIVTQWVFFLPAAYVIGPVLGGGLFAIWAANGVWRFAQMLIFVAFWQRGQWANIKV